MDVIASQAKQSARRLRDEAVEVGMRRRKAGEDRRQRTIGETEMGRDYRRQPGTKIGRHSKIAAFVERVRSKAGPLAVHPAALHGAAQYPDDIAVAVIGAAIAVLPPRAAKFGQHDNGGVPPIRAERFGERCEPVTEGAEPLRQLPSMTALAHMSVPAAEADKGRRILRLAAISPASRAATAGKPLGAGAPPSAGSAGAGNPAISS